MESLNILKIIYIIIIILLEKVEQRKFFIENQKTGDNIDVKKDFTKKKNSYVQKEYEIL